MGWENTAENKFIEGFDRNREHVHPTIESAHKLATKLFEENEINPRDFVYNTRHYSKEGVDADMKKVEEYEKKFSPDNAKKPADVFEAIMLQSELYNWFGQNSETIKTSRYDDIFNGIDMMVELEDASARQLSHLGVAVDVTFGTAGLEKKFKRTKNELDHGTLAEVRYFHSEKEGVREPRKNVPRVVVGIEHDRVAELAALWLQRKNKELAQHPAQRLVLEQILAQLKIYKEYAEKGNKPELAAIYEKDIVALEPILEEKKNIKLGVLQDDRVWANINEQLARMF